MPTGGRCAGCRAPDRALAHRTYQDKNRAPRIAAKVAAAVQQNNPTAESAAKSHPRLIARFNTKKPATKSTA